MSEPQIAHGGIDCSELMAQCHVLLSLLGIPRKSPLLPKILKRYGLSEKFSALDEWELLRLRDELQAAYEAIPPAQHAARCKVQRLMGELGISWDHPAIAQWKAARGANLARLTLEDYQDLTSRLQAVLAASEVANPRVER